MDINKEKVGDLIKKVAESKKGELDLSSDEDLSIAIMNLISIEEHFFFTGAKTGKPEYFDLLDKAREMRKELLKRIIKDYEGEVWCLPPETAIYTNPAPKAIEDVSIDEKVFTGDGEFLPVSKVFEREYKGEMVKIFPYYSDPLRITLEHSVLCATDVRIKQKNLWRKNFKTPNIVWKEAKDLLCTDFLLFPRYKKAEDLKKINIDYSWENKGCFKPTKFYQSSEIKTSKELMELIGFYISEGSVSERWYDYKGSKKHSSNLYFSFGKHEKELINKVKNNFEKVFGFSIKTIDGHTTTDLVCSKRLVVKFFSQFGKKCSDKQLPMWVINLPSKKLFPLIWALIKGDGSESKNNISYFTISKKLAYQLRLILFKIGIIHSLHIRAKEKSGGGYIKGRKIVPSSDGFSITISGDAARILQNKVGLKYDLQKTSGNFGYILEDYVMLPIKKIEKENYFGKVYNLEVPGAQTYVTFAGIVHNCISKHLLSASMRLMEVGTKALGQGKKQEAEDMFKKAYDLYSLFWGINLKLVDIGEVKKIGDDQIDKKDDDKKGIMSKLGKVVQYVINCCKE